MNNTTTKTPLINLRDNSKRSKNIIIAFWVLIGLQLVAIVSGYLQLELLQVAENGGYYTDEEATLNDLREGIVGITQFVCIVIVGVLFIMWFRRAYVNAGSISDRKLKHDDSWAIWGFVIPIISLWYPYNFASEINEKMDRFLKNAKSGYIPTEIGWAIGLWWALYIISSVVSNIAFRLVLKEDTIEGLVTATQAYIFSDLFDIIAALVTIMMIIKMSEKEKIVKETVIELNKKNTLLSLAAREEE